jgi:N-acetyltransferase
MSWIWPEGFTCLQGGGIRLEPLTADHIAGLAEAASSATEWEWDNGFVPRPADMHDYVSRAISAFEAGRSFPFAVCLADGQPIGTSWYRVYDDWRRKVEIGFTWYGRSARKSFVNRQTKLLLMSHAFETLGCILVEFLVHVKNSPSREAMTRLGAHQDGSLRRVIPMKNGTFGDVIVFSVADAEWPAVKEGLEAKLKKYAE